MTKSTNDPVLYELEARLCVLREFSRKWAGYEGNIKKCKRAIAIQEAQMRVIDDARNDPLCSRRLKEALAALDKLKEGK